MTNSRIKRTWAGVQNHISKTVANVTKDNNQVDWSREELLITRLENTLGKPRVEVTKMISKDLMDLLTMVPFSSGIR